MCPSSRILTQTKSCRIFCAKALTENKTFAEIAEKKAANPPSHFGSKKLKVQLN
jgi:hypothetical protein